MQKSPLLAGYEVICQKIGANKNKFCGEHERRSEGAKLRRKPRALDARGDPSQPASPMRSFAVAATRHRARQTRISGRGFQPEKNVTLAGENQRVSAKRLLRM